jgi:type I restriction enzyme R subunit
MSSLTEDTLVQETTAEYFRGVLGWESLYAFNEEVLGPGGTLGRRSENDIVLERYLRRALERLNPDLPAGAYESAIKQITETSVSKATLQMNREKYALYKNGVTVSFRNKEVQVETRRLSVFDFDNPESNHFLAVRELWLKGRLFAAQIYLGLPAEAYSPQEVEERADAIFAHVFSQYAGPQPVYAA